MTRSIYTEVCELALAGTHGAETVITASVETSDEDSHVGELMLAYDA